MCFYLFPSQCLCSVAQHWLRLCPCPSPAPAGSSDDDTFYDRTAKTKPGGGAGAKKGKGGGGGAKQEASRRARGSRLHQEWCCQPREPSPLPRLQARYRKTDAGGPAEQLTCAVPALPCFVRRRRWTPPRCAARRRPCRRSASACCSSWRGRRRRQRQRRPGAAARGRRLQPQRRRIHWMPSCQVNRHTGGGGLGAPRQLGSRHLHLPLAMAGRGCRWRATPLLRHAPCSGAPPRSQAARHARRIPTPAPEHLHLCPCPDHLHPCPCPGLQAWQSSWRATR